MGEYLINPFIYSAYLDWVSTRLCLGRHWWYKGEDDTILLLMNLRGLGIAKGIEQHSGNKTEIEAEQRW